jgi:hypothetical protein
MVMNCTYADGIGKVSVVNGMAHIDFVMVEPPAKEGEQHRAVPVERIVMPLPQFIRLCADMASNLRSMEEQGLIKRDAGANGANDSIV